MQNQPTCTIDSAGTKRWTLNGKQHRLDGPAIECSNGNKYWYVNGKPHRLDGPAIEWADGYKSWYVNGKSLTKEQFDEKVKNMQNQPTCTVDSIGNKYWQVNGELHRTDGPAAEYADGTKEWYVDGKRHRVDGPAIEEVDGNKEWHINGELHRLDGPAFELANGDKQWWVNGKRHRVDGPAIECADGDKSWYVDGKPHRLDGPAVEYVGYKSWWIDGKQLTETEFNEKIEKLKLQPTCETDEHGNKRWKLNGKLHRLDGPAIERADGHKEWFVNDKRHRLDGPAIEHADGYKEWWVNDKRLTETEFNEKVENQSVLIIDSNGNKRWKLNGELHRTDGPAIECTNGDKWWYVDGKPHRLDGPAVEWTNGSKAWWIEGKYLTEQEFNEKIVKLRAFIPDTTIPIGKKITLNISNAIIFNTINAALFAYTAFMTEINILQPKTSLDLAVNMWYIMTIASVVCLFKK